MSFVQPRRPPKSDNREIKLGKAPTDIFELEDEISAIHSCSATVQPSTPISINKQQLSKQVFETFSLAEVATAKVALDAGHSVQLNLSQDPKPRELLTIASRLGFDVASLQTILSSSSEVVKQLLDTHIGKLKSQYSSLSNVSHPYQATSNGGYLFHCKDVRALECNPDLSAKVQITLDMDFAQIVENDSLFNSKFVYELSRNVFQCPASAIRVQEVRAGSVVVLIGGITLVTLALAGVFALSVKLHQRQQVRQAGKKPVMKPLQASRYKEIKHMKIPARPVQQQASSTTPEQESFVSSIFSKIKSSVDVITATFAGEAEKQDVDVNADGMYAQLVEMGFEDSLCSRAAQKHPKDIHRAMDWMSEQSEHSEESEKSKKSMQSGMEEKEMELAEHVEMVQEKMLLSVGDAVWLDKHDYVRSATVVAVNPDGNTVTVEYDVTGCSSKESEVMDVNDPCLLTAQNACSLSLEGCVEITKSNGGYIKAWKTGFDRPMADL